MTRARNRTSGFTLIELLVVIGIIVLLISILLPALQAARMQAYKSRTTAELQGLSDDIQHYAILFNGVYPGPAPAGTYSGYTGPTTTGSNKISGNQNLLIALSYTMYTSAPTTPPAGYNPVALPGANFPVVDAGNVTGPIDYSVNPPRASGAPFFDPAAKDLSVANNPTAPMPIWPGGGVRGAVNNTFAFPAIVDRYPDALPILYYRRAPNTNGSITYDSSYNVTGQTMVGENATSGNFSYYRAENEEYTDSPNLTSSSGVAYPQAGVSGISGGNTQNLASLIAGETTQSTVYAHGGFVLISAGADRVYGRNANKNGNPDDIVIIGGSGQ